MSLESLLVCVGCGHALPPEQGLTYRCPQARAGDDREHVLTAVLDLEGCALGSLDEPNPFVRYRELLHGWRHARRSGTSDADWVARTRELDDAIASASGVGFHTTPLVESPALARALGLVDGKVWIKDETGNVAGSHKARHLMGIALTMPADPGPEAPVLAIASCGNAALAAAVVAQALGRTLETFVPPDAPASTLAELEQRGARVIVCERAPGAPPGDPCMHRLEQRVAEGAIPFTVQGPSNGLTIDGGRTLGLELVQQLSAVSDRPLDRLFVQVGGGALASSTASALRDAHELGALARAPRLHAVQTEGAHPLERAWSRFVARVPPKTDPQTLLAGVAHAAANRSEFMSPWETTPHSLASGILDDETYDWLAVVLAMHASGGSAVVATEAEIVEAHRLGRELTGLPVCATGSAGLAGALHLAAADELAPNEHIGLLFTGVER